MRNPISLNPNIIKVLLGATLVSFASVFVKLSTVAPTTLGCYRMFVGGAALLLIVLFTKTSFKASRTAWKYAIIAGLFFASDIFFWHHAIQLIGPGLATIIINLQVFILSILGIVFFKEQEKSIMMNDFWRIIPTIMMSKYVEKGNANIPTH